MRYPLEIIPEERLELMPRRVAPRHEVCFWLHDQMARLLVEAHHSGYSNAWKSAVHNALKAKGRDVGKPETWIEVASIGGVVSNPMKLDILLSVMSDLLHFIFEALKAFEKRKFTIGYTLLRKPLSENLIIICRLAAEDDKFIKSFADGTLQLKQVTQMESHQRIDLFNRALAKLPIKNFTSGNLLYDIIFNKETANGLQRRMQMATHLITNRPAISTPKLSLNSIFYKDMGDENFAVYDTLPHVLFFVNNLLLHLFQNYFPLDAKTYNETLVRSIGLTSNLYEGDLDGLSRSLNKSMTEIFKCEWCTPGNAKIFKINAPRFYLYDQIYCNKCKRLSHTPFTYILRTGKFQILEDQDSRPSKWLTDLFDQ